MTNTKISSWARFTVPDIELLDWFPSPSSESSIAKNIPMEYLDQMRVIMRRLGKVEGRRYRVIYRGPRHDLCRSHCLRRHARSFAIYERY